MSQDGTTDLGLLNAPPSGPLLYNETTYDRQRGNSAPGGLASAARTTTNFVSFTNYNARGVKVVIDVTVASGTGGLTVQIQAVEGLSGKNVTLLASTAIITTGTTTLTLYPGIPATANVSANDILPRLFRINVAVGDASSYTYSIGTFLVV